ncbi:MAG: nucleotidyltransferase family protein [Paraglaciecola sp.]|nr:nucleotidyltransferase family protein [Paraglaciecola sp.]
MIEEKDIERSKVIFLKNGYHNIKEWEPKEVHLQFTYSKSLAPNITCHLDIHRLISNDHEVSSLLSFDDIYNDHCITKFGNSWFKSVSRPYAFIHASIHFLRHKYRKDVVRLIWLYDLFAIAEKMTIAEREELISLVKSKCISNIIIEAIDDTWVYFESEQLNTLRNRIQNLPTGNKLDYLLDNNKNGLQRFTRQLKSTKSFSRAVTLVWETLFPPKEQLYLKYGKVNNKLLWLYYIKRAVYGILKWARK